MGDRYGVAILGLGAIGRRMLVNMPKQGRLEIVGAFDLSEDAAISAKRDFEWLRIFDSADRLIASDEVDLIYIGVPPKAHAAYAHAAMATGKSIFCEKPLGIDLDESRQLADAAETHSKLSVVNLSLAGARATSEIRSALQASEMGRILGAEIRLHFAKWPRPFQEQAEWLAGRDQGGFSREVATHFFYILENLLGPGSIEQSFIRLPDDGKSAETHLVAGMSFGGIPVSITGSVGGVGPDIVECIFWGERKSFRTTDFYRLWYSENDNWQERFPEIKNLALDAYMSQLDELVRALDGKTHVLPEFRTAYRTQCLIEELVSGEPPARA
jgi:1,5-anhydro-D-fructose reductase (1,5-anhydro-D-mannitol-forming)